MIAYNIYRNNERLCVAGIGDVGVLTACVAWVGHRPETLAARPSDDGTAREPRLTLDVGGLKSDDPAAAVHMRWIETNLRVGDEIRIQVVDAPRADPATIEYRDDPVKDLEEKKEYVRRLARDLGWEIRER